MLSYLNKTSIDSVMCLSERRKLSSLGKIEGVIRKFLSQYILLGMLYVQEKNDIDNSDQFFRKILHYISKDLQSCELRTEKMRKIIGDYESYSSMRVGERYKMIKSIIKILSDEDEFSLSKALEVVSEFKTELSQLENKLFCVDFDYFRNTTKELRNDINILQSFLVCGPTHRVILVPPELHSVIREVEEHLKKQVASVKNGFRGFFEYEKVVSNKWQNYRRQLWMYFYTDPQKLYFVLQQIEEEFKKQN
ncbi:hypothetical protein NQ318_018574 [Aromia moschata]|uniref:Uncharacterized protein n=1 Tax=Aromia moschata TaxID=1265417 RepID=A0AAV8ZIF5_9CUCU|nr:hypothetical protein NQ318_018574 [Aromia moschata]